MPADNQEVLDDFIMDMDIETITLDDMQAKENAKSHDLQNAEMAMSEQANNQFFGDLKMDNVNIDEIKLGDASGKPLIGGDGQNVTINIAQATFQGDIQGKVKEEADKAERAAEKEKEKEKKAAEKAKAAKAAARIEEVPEVEVPDFGEVPPASEPVNMDNLDQEFLKNVESDITLGELNKIEEIPEPSIPIETSMETYAPMPVDVITVPKPETPKGLDKLKEAGKFSSEDDIIFIDGNELDNILYGQKKETAAGMGAIDNVPVIEPPVEEPEEIIGPVTETPEQIISVDELSAAGKETVPLAEEIITEEVPISSLDLQPLDEGIIAEAEAAEPAAQQQDPEFNFDLSVIPDVEQVEEDEPIALSLDELNNIDISDENVMGFNAADVTPEAPEEDEKIEISLDELNEIQKDISVTGGPAKDERARFVEEQLENLSGQSKDELKSVLAYLDRLLEDLPEDKIKEFAKSDYYDLYVKILDKLGV